MRLLTINRIQNKAGSLALELVLATGVLALVALMGLGTIRWQLERNMRQMEEDRDWLDLEAFRKSVEYAWDRRCDHVLREGPWLEIESVSEGKTRILERLWMLHYDENGSMQESAWSRNPGGWRLAMREAGNDNGGWKTRTFQYEGRIRINVESGVYIGGEGPSLIQFSFPDFRQQRLRQGFAIRRIW